MVASFSSTLAISGDFISSLVESVGVIALVSVLGGVGVEILGVVGAVGVGF